MLNPCDTSFVETLRAALPEGVLRAPEPRDLSEPRGRWQGLAGVVAMPRNAGEVSSLLHLCNSARVGVVPRAGGTGLVGGQVMVQGAAPLILSMERMRQIRAVYASENVLIAEAGATLAEVQVAASGQGRLFPLTLASQGSCQIGGNLATNAGGVNVLRYGNARDLCLGLEAVLADGTIWHGLKRLRKDNTGYDLRNLLIGSEGSLGIITAASLKLFPVPDSMGAAFFSVPDPQAALDLLALAQDQLGGLVSAFELIHRTGLDFLSETMPEARHPFAQPPEWMVLIDLGLPKGIAPEAALAALYTAAEALGIASDAVVAQSGAQRAAFWALRENLPEGNRRIGAISSHDIALPLSEIPDFIAQAGPALGALGPFRINCFGHLGDGNLHYNVFPPKGGKRAEYDMQRGAIKTLVHDLVAAKGGSVSAEHGIGRLKTDDLARYGDPAKLAAMRAIKAALDPQAILNPGAVLA